MFVVPSLALSGDVAIRATCVLSMCSEWESGVNWMCLGILCCLTCGPKLFLLHRYSTIPLCYLCLLNRFYASSDDPWRPKCVMCACHWSTILCLPSVDASVGSNLGGPSFIMVSVHSAVQLIQVFALPTLQKQKRMACCISQLICYKFVTCTL